MSQTAITPKFDVANIDAEADVVVVDFQLHCLTPFLSGPSGY